MRIGYPGLNLSFECRPGSTFRLRSFSAERFEETVRRNLACLGEILRFNREKGFLFFRITSGLVPFASHPVAAGTRWQERFREEFRALGGFIRSARMRISLHPDQFVLLNAKDPGIVERSVRELEYHEQVLELLGLDAAAKVQLHAGGVYGDRAASMRRFIESFRGLSPGLRRRLVVENDDRSYPVGDCLALHEATGMPVLFDVFHHALNNRGEGVKEAFAACSRTWGREDGLPMVDYSLQKEGGRPGTHAGSIAPSAFRAFVEEIAPLDCDIMLEIKDKEKSAAEALRALAGDPRLVT